MFSGALIWTQRGFHFHSCSSHALLIIHRHPSLIILRSACGNPIGGGRFTAAVAPPKSHNLIHHRHERNPTTQYIIESTRSRTYGLKVQVAIVRGVLSGFVTGIHRDSVRRWNLWFPSAEVFTGVDENARPDKNGPQITTDLTFQDLTMTDQIV